MIHYILQVVAFQVFFLLIYDLFLKRETFFNLNRAYLLVTALLSIVMPFIKVQQIKTIVPENYVVRLPEVIIGKVTETRTIDPDIANLAGISMEPEPVSIWNIILISGMCLAAVMLIFKISKVLLLASRHPKRWTGNLLIVNLLNSTKAFSFFHYIFLGEKLNPEERSSILEHEIVHVNQKHTWDLLFFEFLKIAFWFNPLVYMYQNRMATLHEYIADATAVKRNDKKTYYNNLLAQVFETQHLSFINPFFKQALIKKRIVMLSKSKSKQIHVLKYTLLLPMVFAMLIYTSTYAKAQVQDPKVKTEKAYQALSDEELYDLYYTEIVDMSERGIGFNAIFNTYKTTSENYIASREAHYKSSALMKFLHSDRHHTLDKNDQLYESVKDFKTHFGTFMAYPKYLEYKKTEKAKQLWESHAKDGVLRLVVEDFQNKTEAEQERYDEKMKMIETDQYFHTLLIANGKTSSRLEMRSIDRKNTTNPGDKNEVSITEISQDVEVPFAVVEEAPTFTSCVGLKTNQERKTCMSDNISNHVNKNFNTDLAKTLGLIGRQRISVIFKIGKDGDVFGVKSRAPHPALEEEAIRVIKTLPQFVPGKQKGHPVIVPYSLPILFEVNSDHDAHKSQNIKSVEQIKALKKVYEEDQEGIPFSVVDVAPKHQDCQGNNEETDRACTTNAVNRFVNANFDTSLASKLGLKGRQRISVIFKIDKNGNVIDPKSRASHPALEEEAIRVVKTLPQFIPGQHNGKLVNVPYSLPIIIQVAKSTTKGQRN